MTETSTAGMKRSFLSLIYLSCLPLSAQSVSPRDHAHPCSLIRAQTGPSQGVDVGAFILAYNSQAQSMTSLHLDTMMRISASEYGAPSHLPEIPATIDFVSPAFVRLSVPLPLTGARGFELVGDGRQYSLLVPGALRRTFYTGPVDAPARSPNPTENLRPMPLIEALRWPKAITPYGFEKQQASDPDVVTLKLAPLTGKTDTRTAKIKLDRQAGTVRSLAIYDASGALISGTETTYADWHPVENSSSTGICFPETISLSKPGTNDSIALRVRHVEWNTAISQRLFEHHPPAGTSVVRVEDAGSTTAKR